MIILDTNVLSALMRPAPEPAVVAWLDTQPGQSVWITSITLFESRFGLALLPKGRRQQTLVAAFARLVEEDLEGRVLNFDSAAAVEAAALAAERQRAGRPSAAPWVFHPDQRPYRPAPPLPTFPRVLLRRSVNSPAPPPARRASSAPPIRVPPMPERKSCAPGATPPMRRSQRCWR